MSCIWQLAMREVAMAFHSAPSSLPQKVQLCLPTTWRRSSTPLTLLSSRSRPSSILQETRERFAVVDEIVHRLGDRRVVRDLRSLRIDPLVELGQDRLGSGAALVGVSDAGRGIGRGSVRVVREPDETDANQCAFAIGDEGVEEAPAGMCPTADLDDARFVAVELVVDAGGVGDVSVQRPAFCSATCPVARLILHRRCHVANESSGVEQAC